VGLQPAVNQAAEVDRLRAELKRTAADLSRVRDERDALRAEVKEHKSVAAAAGLLSLSDDERALASGKLRRLAREADKKGGVDSLLRTIAHYDALAKSHYVLQILGQHLIKPGDLIVARFATKDGAGRMFSIVKALGEPDADFPCAINTLLCYKPPSPSVGGRAEAQTAVVPVGPNQFELFRVRNMAASLDKVFARANTLLLWEATGGEDREPIVKFERRLWQEVKLAVNTWAATSLGQVEAYEKKARQPGDAVDPSVFLKP
jgi:hypothetical protein